MFVCPSPCAYVSPEWRFLRTDSMHPDIGMAFSRRLLNRPIEDVAGPGEWTHFMKHGRPAIEKEALDHIQRSRAQFFEYAESETLSDRRVDTIENRVCSCAFNPLCAAVGELTLSCFGELNARVPLRALQTS